MRVAQSPVAVGAGVGDALGVAVGVALGVGAVVAVGTGDPAGGLPDGVVSAGEHAAVPNRIASTNVRTCLTVPPVDAVAEDMLEHLF